MAHLNITLDEETLKELMLGNRDEAVAKLLEAVFNAILSAEATEQLGAETYERTDERLTYRNGYRSRQLTTRVGSLTLQVPKFREGTFTTQLFSQYERSEQALLLSLMEMVIQGVSTRKVSQIQRLSVEQVSPKAPFQPYVQTLTQLSMTFSIALLQTAIHLLWLMQSI